MFNDLFQPLDRFLQIAHPEGLVIAVRNEDGAWAVQVARVLPL